MAIEINKPGKNIVDPPTITLTGEGVNSESGQIEGGYTVIITQEVQQDELIITKKGELLFREEILVELTPDTKYPVQNHVNVAPYNEFTKGAKIFEGAAVRTTVQNKNSETYYTLNGKDPVRTKSNLYTGSFKIKHNISGDNIILKTRTYVYGYKSDVRTVKLRIIKKDALII